jgi:DNA-directed RNA polymerase subunit RPC12/RpoP
VAMTENTCTDCHKPTGKSGATDYLRCAECQIEFNRLLYDRSRPVDADELEWRIELYAGRLADRLPLFTSAVQTADAAGGPAGA